MSTADIIISPARIFYAAVGTAMPADTVAYGAAWATPSGWTEIAMTKTPFSMNRDASVFNAMIEQSTLHVKRSVTEEKVAFETTLAEFTGANLLLGTEGTLTTTAPGAGQPGKETIEFGGQVTLTERTWAVEGLFVSDLGNPHPIRFQIYRATAVLNGQLQFAKGDSTAIPLRIESLGDLSQAVGKQLGKIIKITAPATS
ncbi:MAG: hypothetical protein H6658_02080 [Ardenticatenaceae bacterium]|nr:hypothetical protein [Ardenticatenaceae bacterium]